MINEETLLVLGAGASSEVGFPLGERLIQDIIVFYRESIASYGRYNTLYVKKLLNRWEQFLEEKSIETIDDFGKVLFNAQPPSIDTFLTWRPEYSLIGKFCIFACLTRYEDVGYFSTKNANIFPNFGWYKYLWHRLSNDVKSAEEIPENKLRVITFNYDRSLEFYLFRSIKNAFNLSNEEAGVILNSIPIKHVYGQLGYLPWDNNNCNSCNINDFYYEKIDKKGRFDYTDLVYLEGEVGCCHKSNTGDDKNAPTSFEEQKNIAKKLWEFVSLIKTYHESITENARKSFMEDILWAKNIGFLGFSYLKQNLDVIGFIPSAKLDIAGKNIFGTAYGMSDSEVEEKTNRVASACICTNREFIHNRIDIENNWDNMSVYKEKTTFPNKPKYVIENYLRNSKYAKL